ncbi:hypothetical protein [Microcoleus sp. FACHB-672]|uniref:hypothetical protein n=1 Tax=Microcoleus sp. FACHB-672 TaxID=2692825 RepID=UPI0016850021|nr:hypothetical protein [Microcoleus sp. FACHB-672]MBD2041233.1 hypothetical protein [Microcoleus sp. FACHB-672]
MQSSTSLYQSNIAELYCSAWNTRSISSTSRQSLRSALLNDSLNEADYRIINRMLYAVRRGWLKLAD